MASMADASATWRYRFTLYTLLFPLQTEDRIQAVRNWPLFATWRGQFDELQTDTVFLAYFPPDVQLDLKQNAALVSEQFHAWETRAARKDWIRWIHWPVYMAIPPVLVSAALWVIGEPVFALRSHPYYSLFLLTLLKCTLSPYATATVFKRLHRDYGTTTLFPALLFSVAAFVPGCRFVYRETWYLAINVIATCIFVYWVQYHDLLRDLWRNRFDRIQADWTIGADEEILAKLNSIEPDFEHYRTQFSHYRGDYVHNIQDVIVREGAERIVRILHGALSPGIRQNLRPSSTLLVHVSARKIKRWFAIGFFVTAIVTIGTVIFQWGSFVQAIIAGFAVGGMLILMTIFDHYTLDAYLDYYIPKMAFLFWPLPHVNFPLIGHRMRFSDNLPFFWGTYAALFFENFFLSDLLVYYVKQYLKNTFGATSLSPVAQVRGRSGC
jgi:hypothetical protein